VGEPNGFRPPPELLVIKNDAWCERAIRRLEALGLRFRVTEVSPVEYSSPDGVPALLTDTGAYRGESIERVARLEYCARD
jgi:hypothetical protein